MHQDEELAIEFLLGTPGLKGRAYLKPGSELELKARAVLARIMLTEAPNGYFTRLVASMVEEHSVYCEDSAMLWEMAARAGFDPPASIAKDLRRMAAAHARKAVVS